MKQKQINKKEYAIRKEISAELTDRIQKIAIDIANRLDKDDIEHLYGIIKVLEVISAYLEPDNKVKKP